MKRQGIDCGKSSRTKHAAIGLVPSGESIDESARVQETADAVAEVLRNLPEADNEAGAVERMLQANGILRNLPWPVPFDRTAHRLHLGDARDLSWQADSSVHLVVTSPPYWTLKEYEHTDQQLGDIEDYREEMQGWMRSCWSDIKGESTRRGHPAPYPVALAERLIKMFSFAGDTVLDPFSGTGSTALAALSAGRHSVSNELEPKYQQIAEDRLREAAWLPRSVGAVNATIILK